MGLSFAVKGTGLSQGTFLSLLLTRIVPLAAINLVGVSLMALPYLHGL